MREREKTSSWNGRGVFRRNGDASGNADGAGIGGTVMIYGVNGAD